jgi:hypothetical protein
VPGPSVPGEATPEVLGQFLHGLDHRLGDGVGGVVTGHVQQQGEPASPLDQGADRGAAAGAEGQIALPVAGHGMVVGLRGRCAMVNASA